MAVVATEKQAAGNPIIAVARYETLSPADPDLAEAAIVVEDQYQDLGLGTCMLGRLANYAKTHGVHTFTAAVHSENTKIMRFIQHSGLPVQRKVVEQGVWEYKVALEGEFESGVYYV